MSKSLSLARSSARGGFNIFWGLIISSIISAIGLLFVADLLTGEEFGIVTIALLGPNLITTIRDLGLDQATIKYATQYRTEQDTRKLKNVIITGTIFEVILGVIFTVFSIFFSGFMANILDRPNIDNLIQIASFTILAGSLLKAAQSAFISFEKMKMYSATLVLQSIFKTVLMILLVHLGFGVYGATVGNALSYMAIGLVGIAILLITIIQKFQQKEESLSQVKSTLKMMLKFGLPLSIATMLVGVLSQYYSILVAIYTSDIIVGNYQVALNFALLISIFATSVATILFPTFSKVNGDEDPETLSNVFQYSVKYTSLLIVPAAFAVIALSQPGVQMLFQNKYEYTPLYLSLYAVTFLYSAIGNLSAGALINSQGKTQFNLKITVLTFILGIIFSLILIPSFGVLGLLIIHNTVGMPGILLSLWWIRKHYNATIDYLSSIKIVVASTFSGALTYIVINQLNVTSWLNLIIGVTVFLFSYIMIAPLLGAINYNDTKNLKEMVQSLGPLSLIMKPLIYPLEKITTYKRKD